MITFADRCAWRAVYIYTARPRFGRHTTLVAYLGIDPYDGRPEVFGGLLDWSFRFKVPGVVRWRHPMSAWRLKVYGWQQWFFHRLDGRYGWGRRITGYWKKGDIITFASSYEVNPSSDGLALYHEIPKRNIAPHTAGALGSTPLVNDTPRKL